MSKILLISSNTSESPYPVYPLGMSILAKDLSLRGHTVEQFDLLASGNLIEPLLAHMKRFQPDVIGISLRNVDNVDSLSAPDSWHLSRDRSLIRSLKTITDAPLIAGGPAFSLLPEEALAFLELDYGVVGEGEGRLAQIVDDLAGSRSVQTISYPPGNGAKQKLTITSPLWSRQILSFYRERSAIGVQSKRGCDGSCTYCTYPSIHGRGYRYREPGSVVDEIERLAKDYEIREIFFVDSVFNDPDGHHLLLAEEMVRRSTGVRWAAYFRPGAVTASELRLLKRSGLQAIELGTDGSTDETLLALGKPFSFSDVVTFQERCRVEKIPCAHYIIFGGPAETEKTIARGLQNVERLHNCVVFAFSGIRIFPGTGVYECALKEGLLASEDALLKPVFYFSPFIEPTIMNREIEQSFRKRRDRIFPPLEGRMRIKVLRKFGQRGLLWDKLVSFDVTTTNKRIRNLKREVEDVTRVRPG